MVSLQEALERAGRVEKILKGNGSSPERAQIATELALDHLRHLTDSDQQGYSGDFADEEDFEDD